MSRKKLRIVSLCPSATETAFALGLGDSLCGVSHQCDYPPQVRNLPKLTSTILWDREDSAAIARKVEANRDRWGTIYDVDEALLVKLRPDLILTQNVCKVCAFPINEVLEITSRSLRSCTVVPFTAYRIQNIFDSILQLSEAAGIPSRGKALVRQLQDELGYVQQKAASFPSKRTFIMEWMDPIKNAGHWIPELMKLAGGEEKLANWDGKTGVQWEDVAAYDPEVILVSPCGFDPHQTMAEWHKLDKLAGWTETTAARHQQIYLGNGKIITRYTPRIGKVAKAFAHMLHPEAFPGDADPQIVQRFSERL